MRRVIISEYVLTDEIEIIDSWGNERKRRKLVETVHGFYLGVGTDFEELRDGVGQISTAIVELDDGTVKNVPIQHIRFIEPTAINRTI